MTDIEFELDFGEYNFYRILHRPVHKLDTCLYISTFNVDLDNGLVSLFKRYDTVKIVVNPKPLGDQIKKGYKNSFNEMSSNLIRLLKEPNVELYFNRHLHAKIIATQSATYVGSANYSYHSSNSIEAGYVSTNVANNRDVIDQFENTILGNAISLNTFVKNVGTNQKTNKIQLAIDHVLPMYQSLITTVEEAFKLPDPYYPDGGQRYITGIATIIEKMNMISKYVYREFDRDSLNIETLLLSSKWESSLLGILGQVEQYIKESQRLTKLAEDDDCLDTMTYEDYDRFYGEGTIDKFEKLSNTYEKAHRVTDQMRLDLTSELHQIRNYLFSLSTLRKNYRDSISSSAKK
ncbi:hypothetical protein OPW36_22915 [Vibrio europaeus]|uniref:PLD phosphodiesterase domain-containing protein n=1 Tax=Vibrio europaeus TaxID=300876 RepID=A0AAE7DXI6_9VIBR|nr:hypothetical protein [Vibrio europaeus]MDC5807060.1 hypothetical protein [Vibrio europaeus]MDC5809655.1 hypothetical protein [Vibrio europaeus]MDC5827585.1 hypothetical protein [Vibrio europaeus]MDC5830429.1 hypothetical protein [Vibrio europaeus]MDC5837285.1 hypothetical protein [Vibrio europaeus]